jgi:histidine decarboxylase
MEAIGQHIEYNGAFDTTISGSRSGHAPVMMWLAIKRWGQDGFKQRAKDCIAMADYVEQRLRALSYTVQRNPHAMTILFPQPQLELCKKWQLSSQDGWSHLVCAPGLSKERLDEFLEDLIASNNR